MTPRERALYYLALSFVAAALLFAAAVRPRPAAAAALDPAVRSVVAGAFALVCVVGLSMALSPNWASRLCRQAPHAPREEGGATREGEAGQEGSMPRRPRIGHHPDCDRFAGHRIGAGAGALCAGCTGLATGAVLGAGLAAGYSALAPGLGGGAGLGLLLAGAALALAGLVAELAPGRPAAAHVALDALLVVGAGLAVIGTLEATRSLAFGLLAVLVAVMWADARASLSAWRHVETCARCPEGCKGYLA